MAGAGINLLVIEQNGELRELLARALSAAAYQIEHLPYDADPVASAETIQPQVIVIRLQHRIPQGRQIVENL